MLYNFQNEVQIMKRKIYIGNAGSKNPGLTSLLRLALWNLDENDESWDLYDTVTNAVYNRDGISLVVEDVDSDEELERLKRKVIRKLLSEIPKDVKGLLRNGGEFDDDPVVGMESIVNYGDDDGGFIAAPRSNYKLGDEKILINLLKDLRDGSSESRMTIKEAKEILESSGLSLQRRL